MSKFSARHLASIAVSAATLAAVLFRPSAVNAQAQFQLPSAQNTYAVGALPLGVATADFALTGYPGLVASDSSNNNITVYLGAGTGTFQAPVTYSTCSAPAAVLATDLNADGYPDIAVACPGAGTIDVFLNAGNGSFGAAVPISAADPIAMVAGDFTGSGHIDLAVASGSGSVIVLLSDAATNYTSYTSTSIAVGPSLSGIVTGDFNKDGHLDLAVTDPTNRHVRTLQGDGTGNFTPLGNYKVGSHPVGLAAGDFNHDGNVDLAVINSPDNTLTVLLGSATGAFTVQATTPAVGTTPAAIEVTDVNNDGNPDVIVFDAATASSTAYGALAILLGNGDGTFQTAQSETLSDIPGTTAAIGDFNRDGKPDLAMVGETNGNIELLLNNILPTPEPGARSFAAPVVAAGGNGNMADGVVVGDFNRDGLPDIAVSYLENNVVRVMLNNGNGTFSAGASYAVGNQPYWIASADLNGDGYADLVTSNTTDGTVSVLLNNGGATGTFAAAQKYTVGRLPYQVAIGDLNGDGIPDLAVANYGANDVSILYGQKGGTFTAGPVLSTGVNPYGVAIADFAHNGHPSVAVTCYHTGQLYVFPNSGTGTFGTPYIYTTGSFPTSIAVADFNRDGKLDIVTGNSIANNVSFFAGQGDGTFAADVISPALNFPVSIAAGDINGDGIPDLVTVAPNYNQVAVLLGKGDGTFQERTEFAAGSQPWTAALGDFNNDGKLDVVTANTFNQLNLTIPAYQTMYMKQYPATTANPSVDVLLNTSGTTISLTTNQGSTNNTLTAKVGSSISGAVPTGSVIFEDNGGVVLGVSPSPLTNGSASLSMPNLGSGSHIFTTLYSGDITHQPNTVVDPTPVTVAGTLVSLVISPESVVDPQDFDGTITVYGKNGIAPTGTVTLQVYQQTPGTPGYTYVAYAGPLALTSNGNGTSSYSSLFQYAGVLGPGNYELYAIYNPGNYAAGTSANEPLTITTAPAFVRRTFRARGLRGLSGFSVQSGAATGSSLQGTQPTSIQLVPGAAPLSSQSSQPTVLQPPLPIQSPTGLKPISGTGGFQPPSLLQAPRVTPPTTSNPTIGKWPSFNWLPLTRSLPAIRPLPLINYVPLNTWAPIYTPISPDVTAPDPSLHP